MPEGNTTALLLITVSFFFLIWIKSDQIPELNSKALLLRTTYNTVCLIYGFPRNRARDEKIGANSNSIKYHKTIDKE